jgi:hypothetical protein
MLLTPKRKLLVPNVQVVQGNPSGQVARRLGVSSRTLGRITSNVWVRTGEERRDRVDIGLCVKNAKAGVYVPDYAVPLVEPGQGGGAEVKGEGTCMEWLDF